MKSLILIILISSSAMAEEPDYKTCVFESKDIGKIKFRAENRPEAYEKVVTKCLKDRTMLYIVQRGSMPTDERRILFLEDCINRTFCKH